MMLARIMPARVGFDFRTFECPQCDHVHEVMVATEAFGIYATGIGSWLWSKKFKIYLIAAFGITGRLKLLRKPERCHLETAPRSA